MARARSFLALTDFTREEIEGVLKLAIDFEIAFTTRQLPPLLTGRSIALWFADDGFRNRCAFDLGTQMLGGRVVHVPGTLGERESAKDVGSYLSNWFDALVVRAPDLKTLEELAEGATIPVINARTTHNHPCEVLADLAFIQRVRGHLSGLKVVFVGEATNLARSWIEAAARLPIRVVQVCPPGSEIDADFLAEHGADVSVSYDLLREVVDADVIYTDSWRYQMDESSNSRLMRLAPFRITAELLERAPEATMFLPCPPVRRGEEASADAMTSPKCRVIEAKNFLLHAQNALLTYLLNDEVRTGRTH